MKRLVTALLTMLSLVVSSSNADPRTSFEEGVRLYRENDIPAAISVWEGTLRRGVVSGPLLYNLGNAYYRQGQIGASILFYERARALLPRDGDVQANLDLARLAVVDRVEKPVRLPVWDWLDAARDSVSLLELARLFRVAGLMAALSLAAAMIGQRKLKRALTTVAVAMLVVFVLTGAWYIWRAALDGREFAVVMVDKTDVRSAPDDASQELFSLHEGTKIRCTERLGHWVNIQIDDGRKGWVAEGDVETI